MNDARQLPTLLDLIHTTHPMPLTRQLTRSWSASRAMDRVERGLLRPNENALMLANNDAALEAGVWLIRAQLPCTVEAIRDLIPHVRAYNPQGSRWRQAVKLLAAGSTPTPDLVAQNAMADGRTRRRIPQDPTEFTKAHASRLSWLWSQQAKPRPHYGPVEDPDWRRQIAAVWLTLADQEPNDDALIRLDPHVLDYHPHSTEWHIAVRLLQKGRVPEPETIATATANDTKGVDLDALVRIVRDHWQAHSTGPTWAEVAHGLGVSRRKTGAAIRVLAGHGVLTGLGRHRQLALSSSPETADPG